MYYLSGGPKRSFVREELQVVPEDTELPPKKLNDSLGSARNRRFFSAMNHLTQIN